MAGYMTVPLHNVYKGEFVNGHTDKVENGTIMALNATGDKLVLPSADANTKFMCVEKTTIYDGMEAYRFVVTALSKMYFFIDNQADVNTSAAYDARTYATAVGEQLRAHPLQVGEELVVAATGLTAGTEYTLLATGAIGTAGA